MSESTELKPCPFCGNDKAQSTIVSAYNGESFAACDRWNGGCGAQTRIFKTPEEAIAAWNTRTQPALPEAPEGYEYRLVPKPDPEFVQEAAKRNGHGFTFVDGKLVHINDGQEYWPDPDLNCPACNGSGHKGDAQDMVMVSVDLLDDAISVIGKQTECINSYAADASDTPGMIGIDFKFVDETEQKLIKAIKDAQKEQGHG